MKLKHLIIGLLLASFSFTLISLAIWIYAACYYLDTQHVSYFEEGIRDARTDLKKSKLVIKIFGMPMATDEMDRKVFRRDYGIELDRVAGCVINIELEEYVEGYNQVMEKAIKEKYGDDCIERTYKEAWKEFEIKEKIGRVGR